MSSKKESSINDNTNKTKEDFFNDKKYEIKKSRLRSKPKISMQIKSNKQRIHFTSKSKHKKEKILINKSLFELEENQILSDKKENKNENSLIIDKKPICTKKNKRLLKLKKSKSCLNIKTVKLKDLMSDLKEVDDKLNLDVSSVKSEKISIKSKSLDDFTFLEMSIIKSELIIEREEDYTKDNNPNSNIIKILPLCDIDNSNTSNYNCLQESAHFENIKFNNSIN